jgi:hypothetical protein
MSVKPVPLGELMTPLFESMGDGDLHELYEELTSWEETYICVAKCPELDYNNTSHCIKVVKTKEDLFNLHNDECPCGNNSYFILKE